MAFHAIKVAVQKSSALEYQFGKFPSKLREKIFGQLGSFPNSARFRYNSPVRPRVVTMIQLVRSRRRSCAGVMGGVM